MGLKINKFFLLIILFLLQSCSGGRIGNFLESSFKNIEEPKIKEDTSNNLNNMTEKKPVNKLKNSNMKEPQIKEDTSNNLNNKLDTKPANKLKNKKIAKKNISFQKKQYQPHSYKIIFILRDVDPKDPTEDLRSILRNSKVKFEIEKIERFVDPKNKNIKRN